MMFLIVVLLVVNIIQLLTLPKPLSYLEHPKMDNPTIFAEEDIQIDWSSNKGLIEPEQRLIIECENRYVLIYETDKWYPVDGLCNQFNSIIKNIYYVNN